MTRHPDLDLLERDLRAFLEWSGTAPTTFCTDNNFRAGMANHVLNGGTVNFKTHGRIYEILDAAGFESVRSCRERLVRAGEMYCCGGESGKVLSAVHDLQVVLYAKPDS